MGTPYTVKLFWNERDGSPNMMITNIEAIGVVDALCAAIQRIPGQKPNRLERVDIHVDHVKEAMARK